MLAIVISTHPAMDITLKHRTNEMRRFVRFVELDSVDFYLAVTMLCHSVMGMYWDFTNFGRIISKISA